MIENENDLVPGDFYVNWQGRVFFCHETKMLLGIKDEEGKVILDQLRFYDIRSVAPATKVELAEPLKFIKKSSRIRIEELDLFERFVREGDVSHKKLFTRLAHEGEFIEAHDHNGVVWEFLPNAMVISLDR